MIVTFAEGFDWRAGDEKPEPKDDEDKTAVQADEIREAVERAGVVAHEAAGRAYVETYEKTPDAALAEARNGA